MQLQCSCCAVGAARETTSSRCPQCRACCVHGRLTMPTSALAGAVQVTVAVGILMLYVIMQTFAIPGTVSLSLLSGALYGSTRGFALIAVVSTLGSCSCYCMSKLFGRPVARAIWKEKLDHFSTEVSRQNHDLLSYIIFLRVTPVLPNVFINVASPIVGVPLWEFFLGKAELTEV